MKTIITCDRKDVDEIIAAHPGAELLTSERLRSGSLPEICVVCDFVLEGYRLSEFTRLYMHSSCPGDRRLFMRLKAHHQLHGRILVAVADHTWVARDLAEE